MPRRSEHDENSTEMTIKSKFNHRGRMVCRFLWKIDSTARYRVNWYQKTWSTFGQTERISASEFIHVTDDHRVFAIYGTKRIAMP